MKMRYGPTNDIKTFFTTENLQNNLNIKNADVLDFLPTADCLRS